jgi:hypothetical protein
MNELDNKIEAELIPAKKTKKVELSPLEASIQARKHDLSFPALQSMFELSESELQAILDKLPPTEDCNC